MFYVFLFSFFLTFFFIYHFCIFSVPVPRNSIPTISSVATVKASSIGDHRWNAQSTEPSYWWTTRTAHIVGRSFSFWYIYLHVLFSAITAIIEFLFPADVFSYRLEFGVTVLYSQDLFMSCFPFLVLLTCAISFSKHPFSPPHFTCFNWKQLFLFGVFVVLTLPHVFLKPWSDSPGDFLVFWFMFRFMSNQNRFLRNPVRTQRCFNVFTTFIMLRRRRISVGLFSFLFLDFFIIDEVKPGSLVTRISAFTIMLCCAQ